ncbi:hypothetical protein GLP37_22180 [Photobacterium phosphoreum]|uniref:hypothetical protein n=1 Tax=Photobacterium phosphoreum TaxID=659 RepID=UPI001E4424DE|nr:hypothetical protein [Photobacterium phosphoreum]MCD9504869.1 hypothetical protein [Photobacterium phosphoreum]
MNVQQKAIETLLIANPFPVTFDEKELDNRILWATETYKVKIADTILDNTAFSYKLNHDCDFDMLEKLKAAYKCGQTHAVSGHSTSNIHGHIVMIKSKKQQAEDLKNLTESVTTAYKTEIEQSQRQHLKTLTDKAQREAEARIQAKRQEEQDAANEALISAYMTK